MMQWSEVEALPVEQASGERRLTTKFILSSEESQGRRGAEVRRVVVEVATRHIGKTDLWGAPEKQYRSVLSYQEETVGGGWTTQKFGVYSQTSVLLLSEPTARYSAKGLAAAHEQAMANLKRHFEEGETMVSVVFSEAAERHGVEVSA